MPCLPRSTGQSEIHFAEAGAVQCVYRASMLPESWDATDILQMPLLLYNTWGACTTQLLCFSHSGRNEADTQSQLTTKQKCQVDALQL